MKITVLKHEIELTNRYNLFVASDELSVKEINQLPIDLNDTDITNPEYYKYTLKIMDTAEYLPINRQRDYFLSQINGFGHNKKPKNTDKIYVRYINNPLYILWLPEDSCVWKVGINEIRKFEYKFFKDLTPNSLLTSPIFNYEGLSKGDTTRIEDLYDDIQINDFLRKRLETFLQIQI